MKNLTGPIHPNLGFRPEFLKGRVLLGRKIELKLPNGEVHQGQFAIVDLSDILASHNEETFSHTTGYPLDHNGENINDRDYKEDPNSQAKVVEFAQNLEADRVISTSRTPSGTPIITIDGIVISGNNRTMSIKLALKRFPDKYQEYLKFLQEEITSFGFKENVGTALILGDRIPREGSSYDNPINVKFTHPVLVRIDYDFKDYNTTELYKFNKDTKKAERPIDKAVKLGKMLKGSERCETIISEVIGKYETFSDFYSNFSDQKQLKDTLINCNILTTQEIPAYFYERGFTEQGKELIENLLAGLVLSKDALIASNEGGAKAFRQTIITSLPVLTANLSLGNDSLMPEINEAILFQAKMMSTKMTFQDIVNQSNIFDEKPSKYGAYMNRLLAAGRNKFKSAIEGYNQSILENQGESLFGEKPTKDEIFSAYIVSKIDPEDKARIEKIYGLSGTSSNESEEIPSDLDKDLLERTTEISRYLLEINYRQSAGSMLGRKEEHLAHIPLEPFNIQVVVPKGVRPIFLANELPQIDWSIDKLSKIKSFEQASAAENYEILQFPHPDQELKNKLFRSAMLEYWDKKGKKISEELGLPLDPNYPYVNIYTGDIETVEEITKGEPEGSHLWSVHSNNRAIAPEFIPETIEILKGYLKAFQSAAENQTKTERKKFNYDFDIESVSEDIKKLESFLQNKTAPKQMVNKSINPYVSGNFFTENPDKILAVTSSATSRFKKPITVYKGSLEDVYRIPVDESFLMAHETENPALTVINESVFDASDVNTEVADNFAKALEQSKSDETKKVARKSKKKEVVADVPVATIETLSIRDVYHKINPEISKDELRVYLWYRNAVGRPITNPEWLEIAELTMDELNNPSLVEKWVKEGLLYYFDGKLLPAYLYLAENVYDKKNRLIAVKEESGASGQDKAIIIEKFGQEVYDNQVTALNEVFRAKDQNRLLIRGEGSTQGLILLPISKLARNFMIKTLADEITFKWKKVTAQSDKYFGKMDILAVNVEQNKMVEFPELSLLEAFMYWLRTSDTVPFHKGVNYVDVISVYLLAKPKPQTQAVKDENGNYTGAQLEIKKKEDDAWERLKSKAKNEGDRLFSIFLDTQLTLNDKVRLEYQWNRTFNGYIPINYNKVPVAFRCNAFIDGAPAVIEPEKREAVAFNFSEGSGLVAYDVGVGKTPSAIFTICQFIDSGYAKRPVLVVPNQTYKQWISEFKKFANHIKINSFYNLSKEYIEEWVDEQGNMRSVPEGSVSIMTYEGMKQMGFNENTIERMKPDLASILLQENKAEVVALMSSKKRDREMERLNSAVEKIIGKSLAKTTISIEGLGFDFIGFDEAHACKKVFTGVKGETEETGPSTGQSTGKKERSVVRYEISSGEPSFNGIKGFMLCQYIQTTYGGNTLLLTATPFTNSPLEIYSMLAMVAYHKLREMQLDNLSTFFENYIAVSYEMIINSRLRPERKQVILGFNNIISLQTLIRRFINYKSGDQVPSVVKKRPSKVVLPMKTKMIGGILTTLNEDEKVDTILPLTPLQAQYMEQIKSYANGEITEKAMCTGTLEEDDEELSETSQGVEVDESLLDEKEKRGVTTLKAMAHARNLALSPYIFECAGLGTPTYEKYIETSNKLLYVMQCIKTMKEHHDKNGETMSGVIIYMDRGKKYFGLIKEYLINKLGFKPHEIGIMSSGLMEPVEKKMSKEDQKEYIKNLFLGLKYNEVTMEMEEIPAEQRIKIIIGSSLIREGINLQAHTSTLFNCWLDWNPSDLQQLYGRLYRQGNKFKTVRLVVPLMIDSMDIFMFQKLEEKTSRINTIWESDGQTNVFNTAEFNPHDLKYALIKNANVVAEMELQEKGEKLEEEIADIENKIKRNKKILQYQATIDSHKEDLEEWLEEYRPSEGRTRSIETMINLSQEVLRGQKDSLGKPMVYAYMQDDKKKRENFYSDLAPASKRYWFDDLVYSVRNLKRETRDYLEPNKISIKELDKYSVHLEKQIGEIRERQKTIAGPEAIAERAKEINEERAKNAAKEREVPEVVKDFTKLNYLLSEVKIPEIKSKAPSKVETDQCPPVDQNGVVRIDPEGLELLNECVKRVPSTKRLHSIEVVDDDVVTRVYTPERVKLHAEIIKKLTKDTVCTDQIQPIAVLTGGAPGSGKSTFLKKFAPYMQSSSIFKIDADEIREFLPEYEGWNSAATHEETRDIVNELLDSFDKPCKHDLLYDGTMSNSQKYFPLIEKLKKLGYKVFVAYMDVPKEVSIQRALKRYQSNKGGKTKYGRFVSLDIIEDFYKTNKYGFEEIKKLADGYVLVDSLTGQIVEKGGESMPKDREYNGMFEETKPAPTQSPEVQKAVATKADLEKSLKGAKIAAKYSSGEDKKQLLAYIKGLEITIKYM